MTRADVAIQQQLFTTIQDIGEKKINGFLLTCFAQPNGQEKEIHLLSESQRIET